MKKVALIFPLLLFALLIGCGSRPVQPAEQPPAAEEYGEAVSKAEIGPDNEKEETSMEKYLHLMINDTAVTVDWEANESVNALMELVSSGPLTIQMSMYGGFEQVGSLGSSLPRNDSQTTTGSGDVVLYSGNQIVVFYGSNSWAYTRLGHITDRDAGEMTALLGNGDVTITVSMEG